MYEFEGDKILQYEGGASFIRRCENCMRFVIADKEIEVNEIGLHQVPNATCKKCGRTKMIFLGFI